MEKHSWNVPTETTWAIFIAFPCTALNYLQAPDYFQGHYESLHLLMSCKQDMNHCSQNDKTAIHDCYQYIYKNHLQ